MFRLLYLYFKFLYVRKLVVFNMKIIRLTLCLLLCMSHKSYDGYFVLISMLHLVPTYRLKSESFSDSSQIGIFHVSQIWLFKVFF